MDAPTTDYSNALTVSKKATAAAAGDANTERAYTITLEAKVNISAADASGLYVENLTVTDTIEDEYVLNSVKAELLDGESNVIAGRTVSAAGPTVTHDFGKVQHGQTARLILEVTAQPDFIGSNGVYTNVGLSGWTYKHTEPGATAAEDYTVSCPDTPQVNVPVDFSVNPRGKDTFAKVYDTVTFDGTNIPKPAHSAAQKYDQTRGTFSYEFGDEYIIGVCRTVCDIFRHSSVFRIGGDEFLALLQGRDYDRRDDLLLILRQTFAQTARDESVVPWRRYSAAAGLAVYKEGDTVKDVFHRADVAMYHSKLLMKQDIRL